MKKIFTLFFLLSFFAVTKGQVNDVAFIGVETNTSNGMDKILFVMGRAFAAGEQIYFTDEEFRNCSGSPQFAFEDPGGCGMPPGEPWLQYTVPAGGLPAGTVVEIRETGPSTNTFEVRRSGQPGPVADGLILGSSANFTLGEETMFLFSASNPSSPLTSITKVYAILVLDTDPVMSPNAFDGSVPSGDDPRLLPLGTDAVTIQLQGLNSFYSGSRASISSSALENPANWTNFDDSNPQVFDLTAFSVAPTPVELLALKIRKEGNQSKLDWQTANEINNDRFEIEHSINGVEFKRIGVVKGNGTTNVQKSYSFLHGDPVIGENYYRLKQVDFDGSFEYSDIKSIDIATSAKNVFTPFYPNPNNDGRVQANFSITEDMSVQIAVYSISGKLMQQNRTSLSKGLNTINLDMSNLDNGIYIVRAINEFGINLQQKLVLNK